jgi:epoxide hydrolase 4
MNHRFKLLAGRNIAVLVAISALIVGGNMNVQARETTNQTITAQNLTSRVTEGLVDNKGIKIHYATLGQGPLIILIHGHPDFWYGWRNQMPALAKDHQVVAIDQRGINLSDQPEGIENYGIAQQISDVVAVIRYFKHDKATIVGHDTGAAIAWAFATALPQMTEGLVSLNLPHPIALARERANNPAQQAASRLSLALAQPNSARTITRELMLGVVNPSNETDKTLYSQAFERTSLESFVAYFQANFGKTNTAEIIKVKVPTLVIHGLKDPYILPAGFDRTWEYVDNRLTLLMLPNAGHFVQIDAAKEINKTILDWLKR